MSTISIFFGIIVQMYWRAHPPPHVHACYQGYEALISIEDGRIIGAICRRGRPALLPTASRNVDRIDGELGEV